MVTYNPAHGTNLDLLLPGNTIAKFEKALENYTKLLQDKIERAFITNFGNSLKPPTVGFTRGPKFIRVYQHTDGTTQKSVHSFVEIETGLIYKAKSWKGPDTKAPTLGSIFYPDPLARITIYGVEYIE